jgi:pimeloyl-ACP methyl ester carboxylesterase
MAVDQRSGGEINDVVNQTHGRAEAAGKKTDYVDAVGDMIAALEYAREHFADGKVLAWGSSYSAALVLKIGGEQPALVDGIASFAPGEYFERAGKSSTWIRDAASKIQGPVFMTSARSERGSWQAIYDAIPTRTKLAFVPESDGNHGSRALWEQFEDSEDYWRALEPFLTSHFLQ